MSGSEFKAMFDLAAMLVLDWRTGLLMLLLTAAAISDCRSRRIPNWLVLSGMLFGLAYNTAHPPSPHDNIFFPLAGVGLCMLLFVPLYLVRAMSAGDVKLLAMVGAFLGPVEGLHAALASMVAGGVLSILFASVYGTVPRMFHNLASLFQLWSFRTAAESAASIRITDGASAGKLPYGVAIAIGTISYLMVRQLWHF